MSKDEAKSLSQLIGAANSSLGNLAEEARKRANLTDHLRENLPAPLGEGLVHCDIRDDGTLIVATTSPEWANRLRFEEHQLRALCKDFGVKTTAIKIRVAG